VAHKPYAKILNIYIYKKKENFNKLAMWLMCHMAKISNLKKFGKKKKKSNRKKILVTFHKSFSHVSTVSGTIATWLKTKFFVVDSRDDRNSHFLCNVVQK
jgi:hypothetical protein